MNENYTREELAALTEKVRRCVPADGDPANVAAPFPLSVARRLIATALAAMERADALDQWRLALENLTPGGSEYHNDLRRCVEHVKDSILHVAKHIKARMAAEQQRDDARQIATTPGCVVMMGSRDDYIVPGGIWRRMLNALMRHEQTQRVFDPGELTAPAHDPGILTQPVRDPEELPKPAPANTVRVRAAVAVAPDGQWAVGGCSEDSDSGESFALDCLDVDPRGRNRVSFITATVPLPEQPATIEATVEDSNE